MNVTLCKIFVIVLLTSFVDSKGGRGGGGRSSSGRSSSRGRGWSWISSSSNSDRRSRSSSTSNTDSYKPSAPKIEDSVPRRELISGVDNSPPSYSSAVNSHTQNYGPPPAYGFVNPNPDRNRIGFVMANSNQGLVAPESPPSYGFAVGNQKMPQTYSGSNMDLYPKQPAMSEMGSKAYQPPLLHVNEIKIKPKINTNGFETGFVGGYAAGKIQRALENHRHYLKHHNHKYRHHYHGHSDRKSTTSEPNYSTTESTTPTPLSVPLVYIKGSEGINIAQLLRILGRPRVNSEVSKSTTEASNIIEQRNEATTSFPVPEAVPVGTNSRNKLRREPSPQLIKLLLSDSYI